MPKSISRDVQILGYILKNQDKIQNVIKDFHCDFTQSSSAVSNNTYAFDPCSMYMAQIGENVKLLTDDSQNELSKIFDLNILRYFRNMIDHNYEKVNKVYLQAYIEQVISKEAFDIVKQRYRYCVNNK
ncbi:MAG: hypothetical protein IJV15_05530 [Lachnospiraceae bacterium]|nr:hypothetical protein [Lachnospiraceae bacterium]